MYARVIHIFLLFLAVEGFSSHHRIVTVGSSANRKRQDLSDRYYTQKVNHDDPNSRTFTQRYWVNDMFSGGPNSPIFFYVGGEVTLDYTSVSNTEWVRQAENNNGTVVSLEHRYFGSSQPNSDLSDLTYLTVTQAMNDATDFIKWFKTSTNSPSSPVITVGSSYGANLASWLRIKYPNTFIGSIASSAPVQLVKDFSNYYVQVATSINSITGSTTCTANIRQAMASLEALMSIDSNSDTITSKFGLCYTLDSSSLEKGVLVANLNEIWSTAVQYKQESTIVEYCTVMARTQYSGVDNLAEVNQREMSRDQRSCLNSAYDSLISFYRNIVIDPNSYVGYRQYFYLQCSQIGFFITTGSTSQPFGTMAPVTLYNAQCRDVFTSATPDSSILSFNSIFGGSNPLSVGASNILYSNGALDPWKTQSVTISLSGNLLAFSIDGFGHSADLYPATDGSSIQVQQTAMERMITQFIKTYNSASFAKTTSVTRSTTSSTTKSTIPSTTSSSTTSKASTSAAATTRPDPPASTGVKASFCPDTLYACGGACYSDTQYCCVNGGLVQISFCPSPSTQRTSSTISTASPTTTSSTKTSSTTSSSTKSPSTTSSSTKSPSTTSSSTKSPSTTTSSTTSSMSPAPSTVSALQPATCSTNACGASKCCPDDRTKQNTCYSPNSYQCILDDYNAKTYLCGLGTASCNGQCYQSSIYYCKNGVISQR